MIFRHGSVNINFQNRDDTYCIMVYFIFALDGNFLTLTVLCGFVVVDLLFNVPICFRGFCALLYVNSSFSIIFTWKNGLVALLLVSL